LSTGLLFKEFRMRTWIHRWQQLAGAQRLAHRSSTRLVLECLEQRDLLDAGAAGFIMTNLLSDLRGVAAADRHRHLLPDSPVTAVQRRRLSANQLRTN
jgi:hypothetical protein